MKITIRAGMHRDRPLLVDLFDTAVALYRLDAGAEGQADRVKEQFLKQIESASYLIHQLWHQKSPHEIMFHLAGGERDRALIVNMMDASIGVMNETAKGITNLTASALYKQKIARAEELREMVEDAVEHQ